MVGTDRYLVVIGWKNWFDMEIDANYFESEESIGKEIVRRDTFVDPILQYSWNIRYFLRDRNKSNTENLSLTTRINFEYARISHLLYSISFPILHSVRNS